MSWCVNKKESCRLFELCAGGERERFETSSSLFAKGVGCFEELNVSFSHSFFQLPPAMPHPAEISLRLAMASSSAARLS